MKRLVGLGAVAGSLQNRDDDAGKSGSTETSVLAPDHAACAIKSGRSLQAGGLVARVEAVDTLPMGSVQVRILVESWG